MHLPQTDEKQLCGGRKLRTDREESRKSIKINEQTGKVRGRVGAK